MATAAKRAEVRSVRRAIATLCLVIFLADVVFGIVAHAGTRAAYLVGSLIALAGGLIAWRFLREPPAEVCRRVVPRAGALLGGMGHILRQRDLLVVSLGNHLMGVSFGGAISTFFPIYADHVMISEAAIGTMFAIRALVSAASRFPNSMIARRVGSTPVLIVALLLEVIVMLGIAATGQRALLTMLLAAEGLAFGAYLVAGQTYIAEHTTRETRGAAIGVYSTASNIGGTGAPILLGLIAARWGIATVFTVAGAALAVGFVPCAAGMLRVHRSEAEQLTAQRAAME